ncbi:MAG: homocysteine S-methyltransferase family protein [Robiginitomaculum sp.]
MGNWLAIEQAIKNRIIMLDGAMGTMVQQYQLGEDDYRGAQFSDWKCLLKGNNDLLSITKPDVIRAVHDGFLSIGVDMIETNTFNATSISQADYQMQDLAPEIALAGAKLARDVVDEWSEKTPEKPRAVLGSVGPLSKTLSLSPKVEDPGYREVDFDHVVKAYSEQMLAMFDYVDAFLIETIFDTLNAKAAIFAAKSIFKEKGQDLPLLISGTITDASGRTLSGQTSEAFWISIAHAKPFAVGLNCALGAQDMRAYIQALSKVADCYVMAFPNAGLPNAFGEYDETPAEMSTEVTDWAQHGYVNILGGCCGSTPGHIGYIAKSIRKISPRLVPTIKPTLRLSGLEPFSLES